MGVNELKKILQQVHELNEFKLVVESLTHPLYYIWKLPNVKMKDLDLKLRQFRKEHARFDIFINGQYILEKDYIFEQVGKDLMVKFIRANFPYSLSTSDEIKLEGDVESL
jgi:hypothetical protein